MPQLTGTAFGLTWPMSKAVPNASTGEIYHGGVCHSPEPDLEGDSILASMLSKSWDYMQKWGKYNLNHGSEDIGDVQTFSPITLEEAYNKYGVTLQGTGTETEGNIYSIVDPALASADLKTAHHRFRAKARLGYSIQGVMVRRKDGTGDTAMVNRIAICSQPINPHTRVTMIAKSLGAVLKQAVQSDEALPLLLEGLQATPELFVDWTGPEDRLHLDEVVVKKGLWTEIVRLALNNRRCPPLGGLHAVIEQLKAHARRDIR